MRFVDIPFPDKSFKVSATVVTQRVWLQIMNTRPWQHWQSKREPNVVAGDSYPAVYISWFDAVVFCEELNLLFPKKQASYRLPTEAEWDFACYGAANKANKLRVSAVNEVAWCSQNCENEQYAHVVAAKQPNLFGLHDMHGNVWEWCQDSQLERKSVRRVLRGGSWGTPAAEIAASPRVVAIPGRRKSNVGFRIVLAPS